MFGPPRNRMRFALWIGRAGSCRAPSLLEALAVCLQGATGARAMLAALYVKVHCIRCSADGASPRRVAIATLA